MFNEVRKSAHYQLTVADYLKAQQLYNQKSKVSFGSFFLLFVLTFLLLVEIYRLKDPSFLVFFPSSYEYTNDELWTNIFVFSIFDWLSISTLFPKLDPVSWWFTSKRYKKNFVQQEFKQITISATGVNITSQINGCMTSTD